MKAPVVDTAAAGIVKLHVVLLDPSQPWSAVCDHAVNVPPCAKSTTPALLRTVYEHGPLVQEPCGTPPTVTSTMPVPVTLIERLCETAVGVGVGVLVAVEVGVLVGVAVEVAVAVEVGVAVLVGVLVAVAVEVAVLVAVAVAVAVGVEVAVDVGVLEGKPRICAAPVVVR